MRKGWTHLAGDVKPTILLTEEPMKANVIHALTGLTVLAVPGVNSLTQLQMALEDRLTKWIKSHIIKLAKIRRRYYDYSYGNGSSE